MTTGLLAIDFDGTIVDRDHHVSSATVDALGRIAEQGWVICGATGRPYRLCLPVLSQVSTMTWLVSSNGSEVRDIANDEVVEESTIATSVVEVVVAHLRARWPGVGVAVDLPGGDQRWEVGFDALVPTPPEGAPVPDASVGLAEPARTIVVFGPEIAAAGDNGVDELHDLVAGLPGIAGGLQVSPSGLGLPEIRPKGVSKAAALERLRMRLAVAPTATVAFGDGANDIEMLAWAGIGVAMGDADAATRSHADDITGTLRQEGVATWISRHIGSGERTRTS